MNEKLAKAINNTFDLAIITGNINKKLYVAILLLIKFHLKTNLNLKKF